VRLTTLAPGKVNLCLFVGRPRADGLHPLVSLVQPVTLADELLLEPGAGADAVICPGVDGPNLAARALALYREASGWDGPPVRLTIHKRIPVAAGMGGGSSDAAAALRLAAAAAGRPDDPLLRELAPRLGSDVPALLRPTLALITGVGEVVERLTIAVSEESRRRTEMAGPVEGPRSEAAGQAAGPMTEATGAADVPRSVATRRADVARAEAVQAAAFVIVPSEYALSTPDVYREADRLGLARDPGELARLEAHARNGHAPPVNDLERAAVSLCPAIQPTLAAVRAAGAQTALVSGSGPTVFGVFGTREEAVAAADNLRSEYPLALVARPASPDGAAVRALP
jgi:4-diphosphocytidyl-2-C-methyl-D-erythritol kinase